MPSQPPTTEPVVALVGAGAWGSNHLRVWSEMGALRWVCDANEQRLSAIRASNPDLRVTGDLDEVLADDAVEGVVVATPAVTHATVASQVLEANRHVFVEKPLAISVDDADRVLQLSHARDRIVMVGHVLEYHPAFLKLRELIHDGALGKVLYAYSNRLNFGRVRTEENALWSFAPHDIAMLLRIAGEDPREVACTGSSYLNPEVADTTVMQLGFRGNVRAHIYVSWLHPFKEHRFVVIGDKQMAVFDDTASWGEKLALYPHEVDWVDGKVPVAHRAEATSVPVEEGEPLRLECEAFLEAIETGTPPVTDGESGLSVLKVLDAGERSMAAGGAPTILDKATL